MSTHHGSASILHRSKKKKPEELGKAGYKGTNKQIISIISYKLSRSSLRACSQGKKRCNGLTQRKGLLIMWSGKGSFLLALCKQIALSVSPNYFYFTLSWCYTAIQM